MVGRLVSPHVRRTALWSAAALPAVFAAMALFTAEAMRRPGWDPRGPDRSADPARSRGWAFEHVAVTAPDGVVLRGWFVPHPDSAGRTVVLLHGLTGEKSCLLGRADLVRSAWSANVCLMDLRAHGESGGDEITYGPAEAADLSAVIDALTARPDVDPGRIAVLGTSLGGSTALLAASADPRIAAVVAEAPFADLSSAVADRADRRGVPDSFTAAVRFFYEWRTGRSWDAVDLRPAVALLRCPVLLIHGDADDQTTPRHSRALFEACGSLRKRVWLVPGGRHTWLHTADPAGYRARLAELWP